MLSEMFFTNGEVGAFVRPNKEFCESILCHGRFFLWLRILEHFITLIGKVSESFMDLTFLMHGERVVHRTHKSLTLLALRLTFEFLHLIP